MGVDTMIDGNTNEIEVEFFGDLGPLTESKEALADYTNRFVRKYGEKLEIFDVSVYLRKFEANYFGKPLIFCNIAANTEFGLISSTGTGWGSKNSIRQGLKSMLVEIQKQAEMELYGDYATMPAEEAVA